MVCGGEGQCDKSVVRVLGNRRHRLKRISGDRCGNKGPWGPGGVAPRSPVWVSGVKVTEGQVGWESVMSLVLDVLGLGCPRCVYVQIFPPIPSHSPLT